MEHGWQLAGDTEGSAEFIQDGYSYMIVADYTEIRASPECARGGRPPPYWRSL